MFLSTESRRRGTHGIRLHHQPLSAWQVSTILLNQIFLFFGEVVEYSVRLRMTCLGAT
jgi:hypothetical protein